MLIAVQLDLQLSHLALKVFHGVVMLLPVFGGSLIHALHQLLNASLQLFLVALKVNSKAFLKFDLSVAALFDIAEFVLLLLLLAGKLPHEDLPGAVALIDHSFQGGYFCPQELRLIRCTLFS